MEIHELKNMTPGDYLKYKGPQPNRGDFIVGKRYKIIEVIEDRNVLRLENDIFVGESKFQIEWDLSSFERVEAVLNLKKVDYLALVDIALDTVDFEWLSELHKMAFPRLEISENLKE